jgi:serine/threonine protein kinase
MRTYKPVFYFLSIKNQGVIHRDLKRGNLMFPIGGDAKSIKIVDFGFAAVLKKDETRTEFCGTPGYMAPELFKTRPEPYRHEVDMFSFGSILFQMLSGESPFPSRDLAEAKKRTAELRYTVTEGRWNLVSNPAKDLIRQTLCYKEDRLSARKALDHFWFSDMAGAKSVLRIDTEADEPLPAPSPDKPEQNPASGDGYSRVRPAFCRCLVLSISQFSPTSSTHTNFLSLLSFYSILV